MKNRICIFFFMVLAFQVKLSAQCAMCKAVVEANLKEGGSAGAGLNDGILYNGYAIYFNFIFLFVLVFSKQKS
jgi:hypothetical protein